MAGSLFVGTGATFAGGTPPRRPRLGETGKLAATRQFSFMETKNKTGESFLQAKILEKVKNFSHVNR